MIQIRYMDNYGTEHLVNVDEVKLWEVAKGTGTQEHPEGTVIEGWRDGSGVIQLDSNDRIGTVYLSEVK